MCSRPRRDLIPVLLLLGLLGSSLACRQQEKAASTEVPYNVLLISIDTLRADHLSLYGYERSTTPHLDTWARQRGQVFETAFTSSPWTLPAHVSLFTGLEATTHGVNHPQAVPERLDLLAERLQRRGYRTHAFTGGGFLHPEFALDQGFDEFVAWEEARKAPEEIARNVEGTLRVLAAHQPEDPPFFVFLHTYETHEPYRARQPYFDQFSELPSNLEVRLRQNPMSPETGRSVSKFPALVDPERHVAGRIPPELEAITADLYDSGVASMDAHLSPIWKLLERSDLGDRTIVVFTSDHGELLGEHGVGGHSYFWEENIRIPLVIAVPGQPPRRFTSDTATARLIDVVPTVLDATATATEDAFDGTSLLPLLAGEVSEMTTPTTWIYSSKPSSWLALRRPGFKYVFRTDPFLARSLQQESFDLRRDPQEGSPRMGDDEARRRVAVEKLTSAPPAHRLHFVNHESESLFVLLQGDAAAPVRVKTPTLACDCFTWTEDTVSGEIAPHREATLLLEATMGSTLKITVRLGESEADEISGSWTLDPDLARSLYWTGDAWSATLADPRKATETTQIQLTPQGSTIRSKRPMVSSEVEQQLEALGYVN
ncbi:MAG: sulfatase [Thermoanaerobaculia bacterium]|nr:sulfatase [Thermoanaerobaculia bacterium]